MADADTTRRSSAGDDRDPDERGDRRLLASFRLTRSVAVQWSVVSAVGFFVWSYVFGFAAEFLSGAPFEPITVTAGSPLEVGFGTVAALVSTALAIVAHELIHGAFMARYGDRPAYGVGVAYFVLPYAYARSDGTRYTRNQLLVVLLAPLVVVSLVGLVALAIAPSSFLIVPLAVNAAGSIGDLWMAALLCGYSSDVRVAELPSNGGGAEGGFAIYGTPSDRSIDPDLARTIAAFCYGAVGTVAATTVGIVAGVVVSLAFGSGNLLLGDPDGFWFLVRHEVAPGGLGASLEVGVPLVAALSILGGALVAVGDVCRRRFEGS